METLAAPATRPRNNGSGSRLIHRAWNSSPHSPPAAEVVRWLNLEAWLLTRYLPRFRGFLANPVQLPPFSLSQIRRLTCPGMEEQPAKQDLAGFWPFTCQVKGRLTR
jgi:hypothetical protein